ncbi:MAG: hypothetical protein R8K54_07045 [Mariprofundaceae bacterium]
MYLTQRITLNLTRDNEGKLEKPSKVFNKIKATFSGGMTPAETGRAEVMLSVLQRINKSFRVAKMTNLVSLAVNDQAIYQDKKGVDNDLKEGISHFVRAKAINKIAVFKRLEQIVEHTTGGILFVYDINVLQKPKKGEPPVTIVVSGFPSQFKLKTSESISDFGSRITNYVKNNLDTNEKIMKFNAQYLHAFDHEVDRFSIVLEHFFPAGCAIEKHKVRLLSKRDQTRLKKRIGSYFKPDILFMYYWLNAKTTSSYNNDLFEDGLCDWFDDVLDSDDRASFRSISASSSDVACDSSSDSEGSWIDRLSEFFSEHDCDESSCDSSCGGSCGD